MFDLNAAERQNFGLHLKEYYDRRRHDLETSFRVEILDLVKTTAYLSEAQAKAFILDAVTDRLLLLDEIYEHLDSKRFRVADPTAFRRKCSELAKLLIAAAVPRLPEANWRRRIGRVASGRRSQNR